jgi:predicted nucleic acid-binding protein
MADTVVLDAGPLVALLDRNDPWHDWARAQLVLINEPLLTCEGVVSECAFLLEQSDHGYRRLMALFQDGIVRLSFDLNDHMNAVATLMAKYHDVPMSVADACLFRIAELNDRPRVFTLDADFKVYRRHGRQTIPLIYPAP